MRCNEPLTTIVARADATVERLEEPWSAPVLIVLPTLNEAAHIESVLEVILAEIPPAAAVRVVVADGGSTDATVKIVERVARNRPIVACVHSPGRLQSSGINLAARLFGKDVHALIRCDAHSEYPSGFCRRLLETLQRTKADAVVVPMDSTGDGALQRAVAWVSNSVVGTGGSAHRAGTISGFVDHGHHAAFRMDSFRRAGGYDEGFSHNEDAEFDCRQRALGGKIYLDAENRLQYRPRSSFSALWKQYFHYGVGRSRTVRRHPGSMRFRQFVVPAHLALTLLAFASRSGVLLLWPVAYASALAATSLVLAVRHRSLHGLLCGPAAALMHTAWAWGFFCGLGFRRERPWIPSETLPLW